MTRLSVSSYELFDQADRDSTKFDITTYMLGQDVRNSILPFRSAREIPSFLINCDGAAREKTLGQINVLFHDTFEPLAYMPTDVIEEFIRNTAHRLVYYNKLSYEIVEQKFDRKDLKRIGQNLDLRLPYYFAFPIPGRVISLVANCYQLIPYSRIAKVKKALIKIPKKGIWFLRLPPEFGSSLHLFLTRKLRQSASEFMPGYLKGKNFLTDKHFNISAYLEARKLLSAQSTLDWGWNGRSLWLEQVPEYYYFYREISFSRSLALLRQEIVKEMNRLVKRLEIKATIAENGLPSPGDYERLQHAFELGNINFSTVSAKLRKFEI